MHEIQDILIHIACVALLAPLAARLGLAEPIVFVLAGLVLGLVPHFPAIPLDPEVLFFLFLPPLLFLQAYFTSWREFCRNLRPITLLAVGLVLFTSAGVAYACHWLIPGLPLAAGFVLGGIVSPPDAVAVAAVARRLRLPRRLVSILEGESLINDASGLVVLKFALVALASGSFSASEAALRFLWVAAGGIGIGLGLGWGMGKVFHRIRDDSVAILTSLLVPFAAYFPAEHLGVSGVLAVVASGLWIGWEVSERIPFSIRLKGNATWRMIEYLLNGLIFLMIGLQIRYVVADLRSDYSGLQLASYAVGVSLLVMLLRPLWVFPATYLQRWIFPSIARSDPSPPPAVIVALSWAGIRGVVSLAAALALPRNLEGGIPFPHRDLIVFLTFSVILSTLVFQGLTFPALIRWLDVTEKTDEAEENRSVREGILRAGLNAVDSAAAGTPMDPEALETVRKDYQSRLEQNQDRLADVLGWSEHLERRISIRRLQETAIRAQRQELARRRRNGEVHEELRQRIQEELDIEEARLPVGPQD
jgi:CPA1 family monovalent cation:H+ antiporter